MFCGCIKFAKGNGNVIKSVGKFLIKNVTHSHAHSHFAKHQFLNNILGTQEGMQMYIGDGNIGDIIKVLRNERGMTREQLAEKSEISLSHLNKIEAGIKKPSIVTYQKIMNILRVEISIREEGETEKGKCVAKARTILLNQSENKAKYLLKILECAADNLNLVGL